MAQPPGRETTASPKRASMGPRTRIDARIDFTSSYGANSSRIVEQSTSMFMRSSTTSSTPMRPSSSMVVVMSCRWGMLPTLTVPSASRVAARIGSAAFLAPEMRISPSRGIPPVMMSLSIRRAPDAAARWWGTRLGPLREGLPHRRHRAPSGRSRACGHAKRDEESIHEGGQDGTGGAWRHRPSCSHWAGVYVRNASAWRTSLAKRSPSVS